MAAKIKLREGTQRMFTFLNTHGNFLYSLPIEVGRLECYQYKGKRVLLCIGSAGGCDVFYDLPASSIDEILQLMEAW